jgi:hypothetical protein
VDGVDAGRRAPPNRSVVFGGLAAGRAPQAQGWLVDDRRPGATGERYLIMDDGDVWRATGTGASPALDAAVARLACRAQRRPRHHPSRSLSDARLVAAAGSGGH